MRFCSSSFSRDVDLRRLVRHLVDVGALALFERLEVPELVDALDAVLQRFGVEHAVFDQAHLAADDRVVRRRVAEERDAVDEVLHALPAAASSRRRWPGSGAASASGTSWPGVGSSRNLKSGNPVNSQ